MKEGKKCQEDTDGRYKGRKEGTGRNGMNDIGSKNKDKSRKIKRNRIRRES